MKTLKLTQIGTTDNPSRHGQALFAKLADMLNLVTSLVFDGWLPDQKAVVYALQKPVLRTQPMEYSDYGWKPMDGDRHNVTKGEVDVQYVAFGDEVSHGINSGSRRFALMPYVNAIRVRLGMKPITEIPVEFKAYKSDADRIADNISLNTKDVFGKQEVSYLGVLYAASILWSANVKETEIGRRLRLERGTTQKIAGILKLDSKFPDLGVASGVIDGTFPWGPLNKETMRKLAAEGTEESALEYLKAPKKTNGNAPKPASGKDIGSAIERAKTRIVRTVLGAVKDNKLNALSIFNEDEYRKILDTAFDQINKIEQAKKEITKVAVSS